MAIATMQFMSKSLWRVTTYTALLPDGDAVGPGPFPVLYQLHGGNQNHRAWLDHTKLAQYVQDLPLIVIMPDGAQSRWANGRQPFARYEDFLIADLAEHVVHTFHTTSGGWGIGGNSMGGFGALRLGLRWPDRFASVWAHSGGYPTARELPDHWFWDGRSEDLDCYELATKSDPSRLPRISFDCGTSDHLLSSNRQLHAFLEARGIPHTYREHPGGHDWTYWDRYVQDALAQHSEVLKLP
jgi:S-formylglutathione hydrolase FrmB